MFSQGAIAYRNILHELGKSAIYLRKTNKAVTSSFRSIIEKYRESKDPRVLQDIENAILLLQSQREHKCLLERYNPLIDLTAEERIHATARRVGLDMPMTHKPESN